MLLEPSPGAVSVTGRNRAVEHRVPDRVLHTAHPRPRSASSGGHELVTAQRVTQPRHLTAGVQHGHALGELIEWFGGRVRRRACIGSRYVEHALTLWPCIAYQAPHCGVSEGLAIVLDGAQVQAHELRHSVDLIIAETQTREDVACHVRADARMVI